MICGNIRAKEDWATYPDVLQKVLCFLRDTPDLLTRPAGAFWVEVAGVRLKMQVVDLTTAPREEKRPEIHRQQADVHFLVKGRERIGWYADLGDNVMEEDRLAEEDIAFYAAAPAQENHVDLQEGGYAVLFPWDVHIPGLCAGESTTVRKIIFKVPMELL